MLSFFKRGSTRNKPKDTEPAPSIGGQAYMIGDIHGCYNQMVDLLMRIQQDIRERPEQNTHIIFLGDLIDRGPDSAKVIDFLINYSPEYADVSFLMGNHEEVFLSVMKGDIKSLTAWMEFGGRSCLRSYKVENLGLIHADPARLMRETLEKVPKAHIDFITGFEDYIVKGPYLCVHAGIAPGIALSNQKSRDMRWIREKFLNYRKPHDHIVVHGHTIVEDPVVLSNRIAIDTGAYSGGPITALRVDDEGTAFLQSKKNSDLS